MKATTGYFTFIFSLLFFSCQKSEVDFIFDKERFNDLETLHINNAILTENELGSVERKYDNTFSLGKDYYPNKLNYPLANPRVFEKNETNLSLETDYFYNKKDSLVKVILYQWNNKTPSNSDTLKIGNPEKSYSKIFKNRYDEIVEKLNERLGNGSKVKTIPHSQSYQYAYQWKTENLNVYMSMHKYYNTSGQIRLIIYHK